MTQRRAWARGNRITGAQLGIMRRSFEQGLLNCGPSFATNGLPNLGRLGGSRNNPVRMTNTGGRQKTLDIKKIQEMLKKYGN